MTKKKEEPRTNSATQSIDSSKTSDPTVFHRVNECAVKIAKTVNAMTSHLSDYESYNLQLELEARIRKSRIRLGTKIFKGKARE